MANPTITLAIEPSVFTVENREEYTESMKVKAIVSAYSSEVGQTDDTPFLTAFQTQVHDGIVANNCLSQGTRVKINDRYYVVEDLMNQRYGCDHFDIWFQDTEEAINFGRQELEVEVPRGAWNLKEHRIFSYCVRTVQWLGLDIPSQDSKDIVPNSGLMGAEAVLYDYNGVIHIDVIKKISGEYMSVCGGNIIPDEYGCRVISLNDKSIIGFWATP